MSFAAYLAGVVALGAMFGPLAFGAIRWMRRAGVTGVEALLGVVVGITVGVVVVSELVGSFGGFRRWEVIAGCMVLGVGAGLVAGRTTPLARTRFPRDALSLFALAVAVFVCVRWSVGVVSSLRNGPLDVDTMSYHLPHAVRFVQDGWLTRLAYTTVDDAIPYHPQNGELVHAFGMLAFGRDLISPFVNLGWLGAALAGAWSVGRRLGRGAIATIGCGALLATTIVTTSQGGSAMTDIVAMAFMLLAVAALCSADDAVGDATCVVIGGGFAAGLAVGSKLTLLAPIAALTILALVVHPGMRRARFAVSWLGPMSIAGGFWYVRNVAYTGTPVPSMTLHVGPLSLPHPPMLLVDRYGYSVARYLFDARTWRAYFVPGLARAFGPLWPLAVCLPIAVMIAALVAGRDAMVRGLGAVGLASVVAYAVTPTTALGTANHPTLFTGNLRYLVPALVLGACLAPAVVPKRLMWPYVALVVAPLVAGMTRDWQPEIGSAVAIGVGVVALFLLVALIPGAPRSIVVGTTAVVLVAVVGTGFIVQRGYVADRYQSPTYRSSAFRAQFTWAQSVHNARIGMAGFFMSYPLYGADLSNRVSYVGDLRPDGAFTDYRRCSDWRRAVTAGRFDYIVTMPPFPDRPEPAALGWTASDRNASVVLRRDGATVFAISGPLAPFDCAS